MTRESHAFITLFQIDREEVEDDEDRKILLIWDFHIDDGLSATATAIAPKMPSKDNMPTAALLDLNSCDCNCCDFPNVNLVLLRQNSLQPHRQTTYQQADLHRQDERSDEESH